ncbi:hypothetical protein Tco_0451265 [Tanacetum coccineum]
MHDEPMWAANRVVAPTPGSAITIPETENEFAIKGPNFLVCKLIRIKTVLKFDFLRSTSAYKWLLGIIRFVLVVCEAFVGIFWKAKQSSLIPLSHGSFDVLMGMDRLSKRKFGIVCHGKVVRIPLEGDEILHVHGERTQGVMKTLMNKKTKVSYDLVIFHEEHQCCLLRRGAWSSFEVRVGITEEGEVVTYLRFIANFSKIVKPLISLTERNQKYEWGAEQEEAFLTLKNDLDVKDKILATPSETSKVGNAPAEMLRNLDQQMEKRAYDGKANVVTDALSRKERVKPRHVRAMAMTIQYGGMMRTVVMDEAHASSKEWNSGDDQLRLRWMIYLVVLADAAESIGESSLIGPELVQETTDKVVLIKKKLKAARDRQKSCADNRHKPLEFEVGDRVMLKVSPWKGVIRFGKKGKLASRYVGPFEILKRIGPVAYRLRLPKELSGVHDTFHVSNLK